MSLLTCVLGAQKNRFIETVLLSTHNICFGWEIRKLVVKQHSDAEAGDRIYFFAAECSGSVGDGRVASSRLTAS